MTTEPRSNRLVETLQRHLRYELLQNGETHATAAERIGRHPTTVSRALRPGAGTESLGTLCELAEEFRLGVQVGRFHDDAA